MMGGCSISFFHCSIPISYSYLSSHFPQTYATNQKQFLNIYGLKFYNRQIFHRFRLNSVKWRMALGRPQNNYSVLTLCKKVKKVKMKALDKAINSKPMLVRDKPESM